MKGSFPSNIFVSIFEALYNGKKTYENVRVYFNLIVLVGRIWLPSLVVV